MTEPRSDRGSGNSAGAPDQPDSVLSDQGFRAVLDALPAAVYTTDAEGRVQYFNAAAVELTGRVPQPIPARVRAHLAPAQMMPGCSF